MPAYIRFSEKQENAKKARFWKVRYEFLELAYPLKAVPNDDDFFGGYLESEAMGRSENLTTDDIVDLRHDLRK